MCTAFVRRGNDVVVGFNMDINIGAFEYKVFAEKDKFYVGIYTGHMNQMIPEGVQIPEPYLHVENQYRKVWGVNHKGCFGNQLNVMDFPKARFRLGEDTYMLDQLIDEYISGARTLDDVIQVAGDKDIVNIPTGTVDIPNLAFHSLLADRSGRIMILEPGNGYSIIQEKYAALSNFALLELPGDFVPEKFGYYGKDRYDKAMAMLRESADDFSAQDGLEILNAVKQVDNWATRVSFVYSNNENAVYYALDGDFDHVVRHQLGAVE